MSRLLALCLPAELQILKESHRPARMRYVSLHVCVLLWAGACLRAQSSGWCVHVCEMEGGYRREFNGVELLFSPCRLLHGGKSMSEEEEEGQHFWFELLVPPSLF